MEANENSDEQKIKRSRPSSFFPRSSAARHTDPLTEGLEQANPPPPPEGGGYSKTKTQQQQSLFFFSYWPGPQIASASLGGLVYSTFKVMDMIEEVFWLENEFMFLGFCWVTVLEMIYLGGSI